MYSPFPGQGATREKKLSNLLTQIWQRIYIHFVGFMFAIDDSLKQNNYNSLINLTIVFFFINKIAAVVHKPIKFNISNNLI